MAGYYQTKGFVLRRYNLGEADRIISFLTNDHGKVRAVARGVRRMKSKLAGHLELFSHVDLTVAEGKSLDVITGARLIDPPPQFDYDSLSSAYMYAEMLDKLAEEGEIHPDSYTLTTMALDDLKAHGPSKLGELYFKLRLASILGYEPNLAACARCGATGSDYDYFFDVSLGGIVDKACAAPDMSAISHDAIKLWRAMLSLSMAGVQRIAGGEGIAASSLSIINTFYEYTFGKQFTAGHVL